MAEDVYARVRDACMASQEYVGGTAYARTKIFCQNLMKAGLGIPGWMTIREVIGKGSSSDISRGVKDFRAEHAEQLGRRSIDANLPGMPPQLADGFVKVWDLAMQYARAELADHEQRLTQAMDDAVLKIAQAEKRVAEAISAADLDKARADGLNAALAQASAEIVRVREEVDAKNDEIASLKLTHLTEKAAIQEELASVQKQRDDLQLRVAETQRHALMQIEAARQEFRSQIEATNKLAQNKETQLAQAKQAEADLLERIRKLTSERDQLKGRIAQVVESQNQVHRDLGIRRVKVHGPMEKTQRRRV